MAVALVNLQSEPSQQLLKIARCPTFYAQKIEVSSQDEKDLQIKTTDTLGNTVIFQSSEIFFSNNNKGYITCIEYCNNHNISLRDLFINHVQNITFIIQEKNIVPVLS